MRGVYRFVWIVLLLLVVGCGESGVANPAGPNLLGQSASTHLQSSVGAQPNRYLWGMWKVRIGPDHQSAQVVPLRVAEMHLNCVRLLEVGPCTTCLTIDNITPHPPNEISADVTIRHPFPGLLRYTGFDGRGILISGSNYAFPVSGRSTAWGGQLPQMVNSDGYTALFNPTEFPETDPPALGYIPGKLAPGGDLTATLNPFIAYRPDAPRRMFEAGGQKTRTVMIRGPQGPFEFGYAVDACWQLVDNVVDPLVDFPPDANCLEAYRIDVEIGPGLEPDTVTSAPIQVQVFDHQGLDTIASVAVETPELFAGEVALSFSTITGDESYLFTGTITNELEAGIGEYPLLVRVVDTETDQNLGPVDAWRVCCVRVGVSKGWAVTWGAAHNDEIFGVALDDAGDIYVTGGFRFTIDFDPGPGIEERSSSSESDAFLSKFYPSGEFQWVRTWGRTDDWQDGIQGYGIAYDGSGNIYVTGDFVGVVDFDPGPGVEEYGANDGQGDVFLSKFDLNGEFLWARTWGGAGIDKGYEVASDDLGNVYCTGCFRETVDFDPGPGIEEYVSNGNWDVFLSKFDSSGEFQWARTWGTGGSNSLDRGHGVALDSAGDVYVTGQFTYVVDFDPGPGVEEHPSNGNLDVFLSKFNSDGGFQWARTWGGISSDEGGAVAVDSSGYAYVTGHFRDTVNFDPGSGVEECATNGFEDVFLSKFDSSGAFQWVRTWGGSSEDIGYAVAVDGSGYLCVAGSFRDIVDFDPGPGIEEHISIDDEDVFLSKLDSEGSLVWARTWGGLSRDEAFAVAADVLGAIYVGGVFKKDIDFDPGPGIDYHVSNGNTDAFLSKFPPDGNW